MSNLTISKADFIRSHNDLSLDDLATLMIESNYYDDDVDIKKVKRNISSRRSNDKAKNKVNVEDEVVLTPQLFNDVKFLNDIEQDVKDQMFVLFEKYNVVSIKQSLQILNN